MSETTTRKTAPDRDDDLTWWFFQKDAEIGQASIHEVQVAMALRGARNSGGSDNKHNKLISKGVVRTNTEKELDLLKGKRLESPAEKLKRIGDCWDRLPAKHREVLELAYGRRHAATLIVAPTEHEQHAWGKQLTSKVGRWSNLLARTRAVIEAHAAAHPLKRRAPGAPRLPGDGSMSLPAPASPDPRAHEAPEWWRRGWAGSLFRRVSLNGPPTPLHRVTGLVRADDGYVVTLATSAGDDVRVPMVVFWVKWQPGPKGELMPQRKDAACFRTAAPDAKTVRDWLDDLTSAQPPKGAKGILDEARKETERMVLESWLAWCDVRNPGQPRWSTRPYTRRLAQPFGGAEVE